MIIVDNPSSEDAVEVGPEDSEDLKEDSEVREDEEGEEEEDDIVHGTLELAVLQSRPSATRQARFWSPDAESPLMSGSSALPGSTGPPQGRSMSLPFIQRLPRFDQADAKSRKMGLDALMTTLSALYGKLLVVLGIAFPMAEVISTHVPPSFYEGFYLYLYFGSMLFLLSMYILMFRFRSSTNPLAANRTQLRRRRGSADDPEDPPQRPSWRPVERQTRYGSFYLRMGAIAFGIGSMIYSGLEFGQYFELEPDSKCHNVLLAVTPATRMAFIIVQMQFIFMKNRHFETRPELRLALRFGLMHMIATNLCVWFNVLIQETKHEILTFYDPNSADGINLKKAGAAFALINNLTTTTPSPTLSLITNHSVEEHHRHTRGLKGPYDLYECRRTNIMGSLVQNASPFLFPCTIEYSLICAVILYAIWKNVSSPPTSETGVTGSNGAGGGSCRGASVRSAGKLVAQHHSQHFSVDCANAHRGLFSGILVLVLTIISLIMFFVLLREDDFALIAIYEFNICELTLYSTATVAALLCMFQMRHLKYDMHNRELELDNILLIIAQTGLYIYSMFSIIAGYFSVEVTRPGILTTALFSLIQTTCQTIFVLDAWWRRCVTGLQIRRKPGRQLVTFLLVTNMAMWTINRLESSRADFHPVELRFYGVWAWTIITHVSMPLAIFYRFHSTVCLCEIWKSTYKMRLD